MTYIKRFLRGLMLKTTWHTRVIKKFDYTYKKSENVKKMKNGVGKKFTRALHSLIRESDGGHCIIFCSKFKKFKNQLKTHTFVLFIESVKNLQINLLLMIVQRYQKI